MVDEVAEHRLKAEACRRLADLSEEDARKALWIERADYWEELAVKAAKAQRQKPPKPQDCALRSPPEK
jgi:hypothetical protein